jgi:DNA-binding NtrC family response regulator
LKILIIDDEKSIRYALRISLSKLVGVDVISAETGEEGLEILKNNKIDLAIVDIKLPGIDGIEVLKSINRMKMDTVVIMITYLSEVRLAVNSMKMGAYDYFTKPFLLAEIKTTVSNVLEFINKRSEIKKNRAVNSGFIGESNSINIIKDTVKKIACSGLNTNILIQGESGTGKEVLAKYIHDSIDVNIPFIALNCAAIPKSLQESELFGYEKGSFSEAKTRKVGLIEKSNTGILFLDEIGDMDIELQAKLLRVLEEKKFRRVGGTEEINFDAMVISATNKNLKEEIEYDNFRLDLYYRLNIIPINIPPLRERREDIPLLIEYFIKFYMDRTNTSIRGITDEALKTMSNYGWFGNIRELKNTIERIIILSNKSNIESVDLPKDIFFEKEENYDNRGLGIAEKTTIIKALTMNNYNITKSSEELGITRTTLRSKMKKYNILKR